MVEGLTPVVREREMEVAAWNEITESKFPLNIPSASNRESVAPTMLLVQADLKP
jgi:hypothetical protein